MADPVQLKVHRCRFVDYTPSPVTALAFPPLPLPNPKGKKTASRHPTTFGALVVGHSNGNIDICEWTGRDEQTQSPQAWVVRKTIVGTYPSKVDSLALVIRHPDLLEDDQVPSISDLRLFSSGGGNELVEWDMNRGCIRRTINSQGGAIWSIAANPSSSQLALACEDGTVRILSLAHDTLTHHRRFDRVKSRILSLAWGPPIPRKPTPKKAAASSSNSDSDDSSDEEEEDAWSDSWLITGCSDSSLRKWDLKTGRVIDRMGVDRLRGERTLVWTVGVLGDGTIISGDSLGAVKFWDSRTCTQLQSFRAHGADVLCHAIGPNGTTVFTSGVDQKVAQFTLVRASAPGKDAEVQSQWVQTRARRLHSHDVRALAMWPPHVCLPPALRRPQPSGIAPVLASGGLDMNVVLTPAATASATVTKVVNPLATSVDVTFEEAYQRRLAYPATAAVRVAPQARLVACMRDAALTLWRILNKQDVPADELPVPPDSDADNWEKVLEMDFNVETNLLAHAVSSDGRWLAVSDLYETKLFRLQEGEKGAVTPRRVRDFATMLAGHLPPSHGSTGAQALVFTPDSSKLVLSSALGSYVLVVDLGGQDGVPRVLRRFDHHVSRTYALRDAVKRQGAEEDVDMADGDNDSGIELPSTSSTTVPSVHRLAVSPDGQWLATSDDHAQTHIFNLDSLHHHCTLPSFPHPAQSIAFSHAHPALLLLAFPDNTLEFFDAEARAFPGWAQDLAAHIPRRLAGAHDPVLGVTFPPQGKDQYALLWGSTWLAKLDLGAARPRVRRKRRRESRGAAKAEQEAKEKGDRTDIAAEAAGAEPEEEDERRERDFRMITHYRPVLHVDFLDSGELVVVERPLVDVLALLPPAYYKSKYGAS
ncbi:WD40 repeat-like protein [Schizophyllum commune H4-8]|uniref:WD40 repeat-like protein n=1 Tax=Schizophyllum commune (strain H4-8 / FGSC 9210) TaxID=578458 RepID=UPI00215FA0DD|nr:WD40 repeat-like protein [Schizophyllum commune H4-8]KAI5898640.1 WD40 repeat-like protein [Schizophyllum commune H4-8]